MAKLNSQLQGGLAAADRVFSLLDIKPSIVDKPDAEGAGCLPLRHPVPGCAASPTARSSRRSTGITLEVPDGHTVALVGPSGAGKSTLLNLIPRFYDVSGGAVLIGGSDVRDVTLASLRGNIALVSQEVALFDDTIRANIAYGRIGATEEEIVAAARGAAAHDFIMGLPDGYDTVVGEFGVKLSGGQRQRISIARAMLPQRADPAAGRGDLRPRHRVGAGRPGGAEGLAAGQDDAGGGAPPVHHRRCRPDLCDRRRAGWRRPGRMASCSGVMASMRSCGECRAALSLRMWRLPLRWRCDKISEFFCR